jgi:heme-degrading monooxygenase HmoA
VAHRIAREAHVAVYRTVPGNCGAMVLHTVTSGVAEFLVISFWESLMR